MQIISLVIDIENAIDVNIINLLLLKYLIFHFGSICSIINLEYLIRR